MRVLVVGGNRFLGREVVHRLLADGHEVSVLALDELPGAIAPHARLLRADRNDRANLTATLQGSSFDAVVDNIAYEAPQVELLADVLRGRIGRYVLTSSVDLYGLWHPRAMRESRAPLEPFDVSGTEGHERYARGKRACERALPALELPWTVLRPCIVAGVHDNLSPPPGARHLAFGDESSRSLFLPARVLDGGPVLLRDDDEGVFKLVWVADVARAASMALSDARMERRAFNVTGDEVWTTGRLARALAVAQGRAPDLVTVSARELEAAGLADYEGPYGRGPYWSVAENLALKALGWEPTPAARWLSTLLESAAGPGMRPSYERRLTEIALAYQVRRRRRAAEVVRPLPIDPPSRASGVLPGRLAPDATRAFVQSHPELDQTHWRAFGKARVSSMGLGNWMGDLSPETDAAYVDAAVRAVLGGLNVLDTAINYRHMQSERAVGRALRRLESLGVGRSSVLVATKGGFITHDAASGRAPADYLEQTYVQRGLLTGDDLRRGHSIDPRFIEAQIAQSLANLGLFHLDVYFLHNPELALAHFDRPSFERCLAETFSVLESAVAAGRIGCYGLATWEGFRVPEGHPSYLPLARLVELAQNACGSADHHLRAIELPLNRALPEAARETNQPLGAARMSALDAAQELGLAVFTSATMRQGALEPAASEDGLSAAQAAAQLSRSAPGVTAALVGTRRLAHVDELLALAGRSGLGEAAARERWGASLPPPLAATAAG